MLSRKGMFFILLKWPFPSACLWQLFLVTVVGPRGLHTNACHPKGVTSIGLSADNNLNIMGGLEKFSLPLSYQGKALNSLCESMSHTVLGQCWDDPE